MFCFYKADLVWLGGIEKRGIIWFYARFNRPSKITKQPDVIVFPSLSRSIFPIELKILDNTYLHSLPERPRVWAYDLLSDLFGNWSRRGKNKDYLKTAYDWEVSMISQWNIESSRSSSYLSQYKYFAEWFSLWSFIVSLLTPSCNSCISHQNFSTERRRNYDIFKLEGSQRYWEYYTQDVFQPADGLWSHEIDFLILRLRHSTSSEYWGYST